MTTFSAINGIIHIRNLTKRTLDHCQFPWTASMAIMCKIFLGVKEPDKTDWLLYVSKPRLNDAISGRHRGMPWLDKNLRSDFTTVSTDFKPFFLGDITHLAVHSSQTKQTSRSASLFWVVRGSYILVHVFSRTIPSTISVRSCCRPIDTHLVFWIGVPGLSSSDAAYVYCRYSRAEFWTNNCVRF